MRLVIQRVRSASVTIDGETFSEIDQGFLALVGVEVGDTEEDMKWLVGKTVGLRIFNDENGVMNRFLIENGYKAGQIDPLPEYSAQDMVIPEEQAIYDEATAGYPFPMGEPISVGSRTVPGGVDYLFTVRTSSPDGTTGDGKVFVSRRNDRPTEFTKVIR